ncbi:MAG: hypothetical protein NDJ89_01445 [Oligoflexia bacterium]|nr:hypothetical protein [Oligoflexia bacterium]
MPFLPERFSLSRAARALLVLSAFSLTAAGFGGCAALPRGFGDSYGLAPELDWKSLETEHFRLQFPAELSEVARKSAEHFEEAHRLLAPMLHWEPRHKVSVTLADNVDAANGLTSPMGRFGIILLTTPPENWFSTYYYDDWLRLLVIHEYTHYLNMDPSVGFYAGLRLLFGDVILPNGLWPAWMLEGLAVYTETRFTRSGRGRSPYYDMILRAAAEADALDSDRFVTLDRVNGGTPYFPGGETAYLFGYQLMNRVARDSETALGELSRDSASAIPYFINTRLEKLTGHDWYDTWARFLEETRARAARDLESIRSRPLTPFRKLTEGGAQTLGAAFSPDGRWAAYTQETPDRRMALQILDRETGATRAAMNKVYGANLAFTPDSRAIVMSGLRKRGGSTFFSDLALYDLERDSLEWLSTGLRARDPDVSRDGKWVVFAHSAIASSGISAALLERNEETGRYRLGPVRPLYVPPLYDAVHTPRFSADGRTVFFTLHRNGQAAESLMSVDFESGLVSPLLADGKFNRFPAVAPDGALYFVSDRTGVDNIYRYVPGQEPQPVTNVTTGLSFPSFDPQGRLHANVFSFTGWDLAELLTSNPPGATEALPVSAPPAPIFVAQGESAAPAEQVLPAAAPAIDEGQEPSTLPGLEAPRAPAPAPAPASEEPYSPWKSLPPRQWIPNFVLGTAGGAFFGGQILGFDSLELHRYSAGAAFYTTLRKADWNFVYSNRVLGPTVSLAAANETDSIFTRLGRLRIWRTASAALELSRPIRWTFSSLTPALAFKVERSEQLQLGQGSGPDELIGRTNLDTSVDFALVYSDAETSSLGITPERGRTLSGGSRVHLGLDVPVWKFLVKDTEYVDLGRHHVLVPAAKASWSSSTLASPVDVQGRYPGEQVQSLLTDSMEQLSVRGYPSQGFQARAAGGLSLDYRFPLLPIYRGWGTQPAFLESLFGFAFAETTVLTEPGAGTLSLPAAGAGARLSSEVFLHLPLVLSVEYHQGFRTDAGGIGELFFQVGFGNFGF